MRARSFFATLFAILFAAAALAAVPSPVGQSLLTAFVAAGGSSAVNLITRMGWQLTPWDFGGYGDAKRVSCTLTISSGSPDLTIGTGCSFTSADVGKYITVPNAGAALSTGSINNVPVTSPGSGYTAIPSVSLGNVGSGLGFQSQVLVQLASASVVSGGTGCPNGTISFNVGGGTETTQAQVSGTVSGGVLGGALTAAAAGVYSILPSVSAAALTPTTSSCTTNPTISSTWSVEGVGVLHPGWGFVSGVTASLSGGNATVGSPVVSIGAASLAATIASVTDSHDIVLSANASAALSSAAEILVWGHDDSSAINSAIAACTAASAPPACETYIPPSPNGYWGAANFINLVPSGKPARIHGGGPVRSQIIALAPMSYLGYAPSQGGLDAGVFEDFTFDGNKLATDTVYIDCLTNATWRNVWIRNPAPQGTNWIVGNPSGNLCAGMMAFGVTADIDTALYTGAQDQPYYNIQINETDGHYFAPTGIGALISYFEVGATGGNSDLVGEHGWQPSGVACADYGIEIYAVASLTYPRTDCAATAGVDVAGTHVQVEGGKLNAPKATAYGIQIETGASIVDIHSYDCEELVQPNNFCINEITPVGTEITIRDVKGYTGATTLGDGALGATTTPQAQVVAIGTNAGANSPFGQGTFVGPYAGYNAYGGAANTVVGYEALGVPGSAVTIGKWTAFGALAFGKAQGSGTAGAALGYDACGSVTTGTNDLCIGNGAGGTTLTTGGSDILIGQGVDSAASSTSNELNIGGVIFANLAATSASTVSCGTSPSIDAYANGKSGTVTCGTGTVTTGTITFSTAYQSWNHCRVTPETSLPSFSYSYTKSAVTINATSLTGAVVDYDCDGV